MRGRALKVGVALAAVAAVLIALVFATTVGGSGGSGPSVSKITSASPASCFFGRKSARAVRFAVPGFPGKTGDIDGAVVGTGKVGVVLAHQLGETMCEWYAYADYLALRGYRAFAFTFSDAGPRDDDSVVAAAKALRALGAKKIVLMGASAGGTGSSPPPGRSQSTASSRCLRRSYSEARTRSSASRRRGRLCFSRSAPSTPTSQRATGRSSEASAAPSKRLIVVKYTGNHGVQLVQFRQSVVSDAVLKFLARVRDGD